MKLLLLPLLLAGAGAGWYGMAPSAAGDAPETCETACRVTVECTERDTCIVTCYDANGDVRCQEELPCDGPCDKSKACVPGPGCAR